MLPRSSSALPSPAEIRKLPRSSSALPSPAEIRKCLNRRRRDASKAGTTRIDPAPTVRPSGAYQTLELCGELEFNVAGMDVKKMEKSGMLDLSANRMFIGAWLDSSHVSSVEVGDDWTFDGLAIPVRDGMPRVLKLEFYFRMKDNVSCVTKTYPVDAAGVILTPLLQRAGCQAQLGLSQKPSVSVELQDPFTNNVVNVVLRAKNEVHVTLGHSAMEDIGKYNEALQALSTGIVEQSESFKCRVPKDAKPFVSGMTALSSGGVPELNTGPVKTHYGVLSSLFQNVDRTLPLSLLFHYLGNAVFQSGRTLKEINDSPGEEFVKFAGDVISGLTLSADACVYQSDCTPRVGLNYGNNGGPVFKMVPVVSENIGLPFSETSFLGRTKPGPPEPLEGLHACRDVPALSKLAHSRPHVCRCRCCVNDDCETSGAGKMLACGSCIRHEWDATCSCAEPEGCAYNLPYVKSELGQCLSTQDLKDECVHEGCRFFSRLKGILVSGELTVDMLICLASSAQPADGAGLSRHKSRDKSVSEAWADQMDAVDAEEGDRELEPADEGGPEDTADPENAFGGGHCCAVLRWRDPEAPKLSGNQLASEPETGRRTMHVEILEGTTRSKKVEVTMETPLYRLAENWNMPGEAPVYREVTLDAMLSYLSMFLSSTTQISNCQVGEEFAFVKGTFGWQGPQKIPGFVRDTMVMNHLHCLKTAPPAASTIPFYRWMMYAGWTCDSQGVGCMPVNEEGLGKTTGCRPCNLGRKDLRAFSAELSPELSQLGHRIFDEVMPPIASKKTLHEFVVDHYSPLKSLCGINANVADSREPGARYETVASMESLGDPAFDLLAFTAKATLIDKANAINHALDNSDGFFAEVGNYMGNVVVVLHAKCSSTDKEPIQVTYMQSLCEAAVQVKWPGVERWYNPKAA